jgi:hypothetical protein
MKAIGGSMKDSKSNASALDLDLERDLPLTQEDVAVLRRLRREVRLSPADYERFLEQFGHAPVEEFRKRPVFRGEPFEF